MTPTLMTDEELYKASSAELIAEIFRLRRALKGPEGFATWQDAAVVEKVARIAEQKKLRDLQNYISGILT
jgi:hypothetical protein